MENNMDSLGAGDFTVCIGGGNFGSRAAIASKLQGAVTVVIDPDPGCAARAVATRRVERLEDVDYDLSGEVQFMQADGLEVLADVIERRCPHIIVPASPGHLMARAAIFLLAKRGLDAVPYAWGYDRIAGRLDDDIVLIADRDDAIVVTSYMDEGMMCRDVCPQPSVCPVTGREHERPMYEVVGDAMEGVCTETYLLRSLLLSDRGGVGGILGEDVRTLMEGVGTMNKGMTVSIATSCSCHAVVNALEVVSGGTDHGLSPVQ
jgi:hypothetical protein